MIVDMRTYTCVPGKMAAWMKLYEELAWPLQQKHLGHCLGFYTSIEGALHRVVHLWRYESQADRETRRMALAAEPGWKDFMAQSAALGAFVAQENSIMAPAGFFHP